MASLTPHPIAIILERDGAYPRFDLLLSQLDEARRAVARGRIAAAEGARV